MEVLHRKSQMRYALLVAKYHTKESDMHHSDITFFFCTKELKLEFMSDMCRTDLVDIELGLEASVLNAKLDKGCRTESFCVLSMGWARYIYRQKPLSASKKKR
ncbi:hypothetical protein CEXT_356011 [Caerostris extrusa]|uniref:Uncharacterized protein n=1 Tax=Caerostris extrusa TaxID=172846 RepID=A0AAV4R0Z5_CAEEX|nr:hypothetical protein CEXT_356011 [Caerostris extrusa]